VRGGSARTELGRQTGSRQAAGKVSEGLRPVDDACAHANSPTSAIIRGGAVLRPDVSGVARRPLRPPRGGRLLFASVPAAESLPSKSEINRCGSYLANAFHNPQESPFDWERVERALDVLNRFRAAHAYPLVKVRMGLGSMVRSTHVQGNTTQRLKRSPRIIRKLYRMPQTSLARLEDVGGCRVVVADGIQLEMLRLRIEGNWHQGIVRRREIQLRTRGQQQWADAIEAADSRHSLTMKDGPSGNPPEMVRYFELAGEVIHRAEYGLPRDAELEEKLLRARVAVVAAGYYRQ
jgi:putative GTP pyrophosphokinase